MPKARKQIGPYEIIEVVGVGGMGVVYRARDNRLDREVAVKVLLPDVASSEAAIARFEREARAVAALSHPNILAIHDFGRDNGSVYAAMEFLDGRTLRAMVDDGPLSVRKAVTLGVQIAQGLAAAHDRNLVHRDLKPENIGLMRTGQVKILDFGLAREVIHQTATRSDAPTGMFLSEPGLVMGTAGYMSPEQVRGHEVDHRSDLFSFGVVFYEMLTARRAFQRDTAAETLTAILNDEPPDLTGSGAKVPPALDRVIRRCFEKHPEDRFHSARDLAFALENAMSAHGTAEALPASRRSRRMLVPAALVVGSLAVGGAVSSSWPSAAIEPPSVRPLTLSGLDSEPAVFPADDLAYASSRDGTARIYLRDISARTTTERPITEGHRPRFYGPDGKSLLFLKTEGNTENAYEVRTLSGSPKRILVDVIEVDPSPDGREIAFVRQRTDKDTGERFATLGVFNTKTETQEELIGKAGIQLTSVRWSPDGTRIAAIQRGALSAAANSIVVINRASRALQELKIEGRGAYGAIAWNGDSQALIATKSVDARVFVPGTLGSVLKIDVPSGRQQLLLRQTNLFGQFVSPDANAAIDVAGDGRLVFSSVEIHQNLREWQPIDGGVAADIRAAREKGVGTMGHTNDRQPAYSPNGDFVIFSSNRSGELDLWVQSTRDGTIWPLTNDADLDWDPAFTPDGKSVLWSSNRQTTPAHLEIWMAEFDGTRRSPDALSNLRKVSSDGKDAENPTMTKDGWIVYTSYNEASLGVWKMRSQGGKATPLVRGQFNTLPDVSPNGLYAAYLFQDSVRMQNSIRVVEVVTGRPAHFEITVPYRHAASSGDVRWGRARWTPDGQWIVFVGLDDQTGRAVVYKQRFSPGEDTTATRQPVASSLPGSVTESLAVSPAGRIAVSDGYYSRSVMLAEHVPGVVGRKREQ